VAEFERALQQPVVRAALEEAGWAPGRHFDAQRWIAQLREDGYSIVPPATQVLEALGGLDVLPPERNTSTYRSGPIKFDPVWAATGEADRIHNREGQLGVALTPVGEWSDEYILLVAEDGQVFAETTFQLVRLGRDVDSALVRLILADTLPELVEP
jgi:hypothetical protein